MDEPKVLSDKERRSNKWFFTRPATMPRLMLNDEDVRLLFLRYEATIAAKDAEIKELKGRAVHDQGILDWRDAEIVQLRGRLEDAEAT